MCYRTSISEIVVVEGHKYNCIFQAAGIIGRGTKLVKQYPGGLPAVEPG
jgi:hypothetical protein